MSEPLTLLDRILLAAALVIILLGMGGLALPTLSNILTQYGAPYGGPPMWDRRRNPREEERRWPHTYIGPQMEPCIYGDVYGNNNCRGPRYEEDPEESWRRVRRRERDI